MNKFPYSNFHDINLDWILAKLKNAVFSVNGQQPDDDGNIDLPSVAGVSSVNGVGPDSLGNVTLNASDVNAMPDSYSAPVSSVNNKTGAVSLTSFDVGAMPAGYVPPVTSVNTQTGNVVLDASDVGALPDNWTPPVESVNGMTGNVVLDYSDVSALPDTTVIPTLTSQLVNDSGFITSQQAGAVLSVNGQVGAVVLDASDVSALPDTTVIPTKTSELINDAGFITSAQAAPVDSVNGYTGAVVLTAADVGAAPAAAGIPQGGAAGYVLAKNSGTDYDVGWAAQDPIFSTDDGWTVMKYSNGIMVAIKAITVSAACTIASYSSYVSTYSTNTNINLITIPSDFISITQHFLTGISTNANLMGVLDLDISTSGFHWTARSAASATINIILQSLIIGRWL